MSAAFDPEPICRVALAAIFVAAGVIGIPYRLRADRAGGPVPRRVDPGWFWWIMLMVGPPMTVVCLAFVIEPRLVEFAQVAIPPGWRLAGLPLGVAGIGLFAWMFRHLGLNVTSTSMPRENACLVTTGPYRWIRHPMYSAAVILVGAATLLTANLVVLVAGISMFALLAARSRIEEARLIEKFGDAYRDYQRHTGRFLPRFNTRG